MNICEDFLSNLLANIIAASLFYIIITKPFSKQSDVNDLDNAINLLKEDNRINKLRVSTCDKLLISGNDRKMMLSSIQFTTSAINMINRQNYLKVIKFSKEIKDPQNFSYYLNRMEESIIEANNLLRDLHNKVFDPTFIGFNKFLESTRRSCIVVGSVIDLLNECLVNPSNFNNSSE